MSRAHDLMERLMRRIEYDPFGGCWLWSGAQITGAGYGNLPVNGKSMAASRVSWLLFRGAIPSGYLVCHKCDVRQCCNPDHLFIGTQRQNMADMSAKGRGRGAAGSANKNAKLDETSVLAIREMLAAGSTQSAAAMAFGVSPGTIQAIAEGRTWKHVRGAWATAHGLTIKHFDGDQKEAA